MRLENPFGKIPGIAGGFEVVSGILFVIVFMGWLGLAFLIPAMILQIILLYKIEEFLKSEGTKEIT
jgi:hypothetical protein